MIILRGSILRHVEVTSGCGDGENCRAGPEDRRPANPLGARVAQERGDPDSPQLRLFAVGAERLMHSP